MHIVAPGAQRTRHYITKVLPWMGAVVLVLGIFMFGASIGVLANEGYHAAVSTVPFRTSSIVLLLAGILSVVAGGLLIVVTKFKDASPPLVHKRSLGFIGILTLAALLAFVAAILGFAHIGKVDDKMQDDLAVKIRDYGRKYDSQASVDNVQLKDECCGVNTYADWRTTVFGGHRYDRVPDSCCKDQKYGCGFKFSDEATLNKRGCVKVVKSGIRKHLLWVAIPGILFAIIEFGLAIAVWYIRKKHLA